MAYLVVSRLLFSILMIGTLVVTVALPESKDIQILLLWVTVFVTSLGDVIRHHLGEDA